MSRAVMEQVLDALLSCQHRIIYGDWASDAAYKSLERAIESARAELAKPAAVPDGWRTFPDEVPPPDTECLVEVKFRGVTFRAVDVWEMQSESPVPWSSATVETGYGWSNYCDDESLRWIPIAHLTAPQPPAPAVDDAPHPLEGMHINRGSLDAAADAYEAEFDKEKCREAFNNFYHKIKATVSYEEWQAIWFDGLEHERRKTAPAVDEAPVSFEVLSLVDRLCVDAYSAGLNGESFDMLSVRQQVFSALQKSAPAVDVEAVRKVASFLNDYAKSFPDEKSWHKTLGDKLARAIGEASDD